MFRVRLSAQVLDVSEQGDLFAWQEDSSKSRQEEILDQMFEWILAMPETYLKWERLALALIAGGRAKLGSKALAERVRWDMKNPTDESGVKIRNEFTAYMARLFVVRYPQHEGVFQLNRTPSADAPANGNEWHISLTSANEEAIERRIMIRLKELARRLPTTQEEDR